MASHGHWSASGAVFRAMSKLESLPKPLEFPPSGPVELRASGHFSSADAADLLAFVSWPSPELSGHARLPAEMRWPTFAPTIFELPTPMEEV